MLPLSHTVASFLSPLISASASLGAKRRGRQRRRRCGGRTEEERTERVGMETEDKREKREEMKRFLWRSELVEQIPRLSQTY